MKTREAIAAAVLCVLSHVSVYTQRSQEGSPPTIAQELAKRGVGTNVAALIGALHSSNPELRGLAAGQLAAERNVESASQIIEALHKETNSQARLNMASALAELGRKEGSAELEHECADANTPPYQRVIAASRVEAVHHDVCLREMLTMLKESQDDPLRLNVIDYL